MKVVSVHSIAPRPDHESITARDRRYISAQRLLVIMWVLMGVVPLLLQIRSYLKFVTPHRIIPNLLVPPDARKETNNLTEVCPVVGFQLAGVWWNSEPTHYYNTNRGRICHTVLPQYNLHGNYFIGSEKVTPFHTTPPDCANESFFYQQYLYHGSIGYYSFYQQQSNGSYCAKSRTAYIQTDGIGSIDINGSYLANYTGSDEYHWSVWYGCVGMLWIVYRSLVLRRSFVTCMRYGWRCEYMKESLHRKEAVVFVQESLRLTAHGARYYHRLALLYLVLEGVMTDLFLIIANDGLVTKIQYFSLGYNLSGLLLLLFEIVENTRKLPEKWRLLVKRLLFSYEPTWVGELVTAAVLQHFLSGINGSDLKRSEPTARAVSHYFWGLICHGIVVLFIIGTILSARSLWAVAYVWWHHRSLAVFAMPCCVDSVFGVRSRMTMLGGYRVHDGKLYYKPGALKAFGLLRMKEGRTDYLVAHRLRWINVPTDNLLVIGTITGARVEASTERPYSGVVSFFDRSLGGHGQGGSSRGLVRVVARPSQVLPGPDPLSVFLSP